MGNLVFGSGAEPGRASRARGGLTESPMERDYDATESDRERYITHETMIFINEVETLVVLKHLIFLRWTRCAGHNRSNNNKQSRNFKKWFLYATFNICSHRLS